MFWEDVTIGHYLKAMACFSGSISYYLVAPLILKSKKLIGIVDIIILMCGEN